MYLKAGWFILIILLWAGLANVKGQPYGLTNRPPIGPFLNNVMPEASPTVSGNWSAIPAFPNLFFTNAIGILPMPGTNLLVVWEREGRIWSFVNDSNVTQRTLVLDIHNECQGWDDSGLLGLAFHPGFATNHYVFVYYTWVIPGTVQGDPNTRPPMLNPGAYHDRMARFTLDTNGVAIPGSETVFVDQVGDSVWHNGGGMFFHPDNGFLYWTDGDDANGANTQIITNNLLSGVFRIDVDKRGGAISHPIPRQPAQGVTQNYYIPNDNPFVGQPGVLEEFFCLGLRSPHRMTEDPATGRIFIGDVGDATREEVDVIEPGESGLNFQWNRVEGNQGDLTPPYVGINRRPIIDYTHSEGFAVIGGYVYRGNNFATDLGGKYIFGDNGSRTVWLLDETQSPVAKIPLCVMPRGGGPNSGNDYCGLSSFGLDQNNELYLCQMSSVGGRIYKLSRTGAPPASRPLPTLLSQTGAFADLATLAPAPGLIPYAVNSPLWSDGALKTRWIALATNTTINFAPTGEWSFPSGTVLVKHFELAVDDTNTNITRRLETRLLVCDTNGQFYGASYKWRADYSDADLIPDATNEDIVIATATGTRIQTWSYPGRQDCLRCHTLAASGVLGVKTRQLNGNFTYTNSGVTDNQIRAWNHIGMFSSPVDESAISNYTKLVKVTDTNATLEFRARSYLDANCSQCHRPAGVPALFDARIDTPLASQGLTNGFVVNSLNIPNARVICPADTNKSILFLRDNSLSDIKMPPLTKNVIDSNAVAVIAAWINSLPPNPNALPAPWSHTDVGSVGLEGDATFAIEQFNLFASGTDIWGNADQCHFVYQALTGDGEIRARVVSVYNSDGWAKAGVMIRETMATGAKEAFVCVTPGNGTAFIRRTNTDDISLLTAGTNAIAPYWVRLVRAGNVFTGYTSGDGNKWTVVDSVTNVMNSQVYVGLAVTAHNNQFLNSSVIDHVLLLAPLTVQPGANPSGGVAAPQTVQFTAQGVGGLGDTDPFDTTDDHRGSISAQGQNTGGGEIAVNAFDNLTATKWLDFATNNPLTRASWIQYQYSNGLQCALSLYTVTSANDSPERDPMNWRLLGSNNGGTNWTVLDIQTNQVFASRFLTEAFSVTNSAGYNVYRLQIDSVTNPAAANSVQLSEVEFIGLPVYTYAWSFGDGATSTAQNPTHTYTTNGTYTVSVTVADGTSITTNSLTVTFSSTALALVANATPSAGIPPQMVQFFAQASGGKAAGAPFGSTDDHKGTIAAQGENPVNNEVATNAFDNNPATKWLDFANGNPTTRASWIEYEYSNQLQYVVTQYTITSANDSPERDPRDWRLLGSNDGGANWVTLDTQLLQFFTNRFQTLGFSFINTTGYNLYRLQIDSVAGPGTATCVQLSELELIGLPLYSYWWSFGDGATLAARNPQHLYATNGIFVASVTATDGSASVTNGLTVTMRPPPTWMPASTYVLNGAFHLSLAGTTGITYVVEATTDLKTWTPILTNTATGNVIQLIDTQTTNHPFRFYRAHE